MKNILTMETNLINDGKNIETTVMYEGEYANIIKGASLGVSRLVRLMAEESTVSVTKEEWYEIFKLMIEKDIYENVR